jgi:hypothetical protein
MDGDIGAFSAGLKGAQFSSQVGLAIAKQQKKAVQAVVNLITQSNDQLKADNKANLPAGVGGNTDIRA